MSIKDQLDADVESFFDNIKGQLPESQRKTLKLLIDKYANLYSIPVLLDKNDFEMVKQHAHSFFINNSFPKKVGTTKRELDSHEANVLAIIEGTIMVLNGKECFKKLPKFDYKD